MNFLEVESLNQKLSDLSMFKQNYKKLQCTEKSFVACKKYNFSWPKQQKIAFFASFAIFIEKIKEKYNIFILPLNFPDNVKF